MSGETSPSVFYTVLQRRLHWAVLLLLLVQYVLQSPMREAIAAIERQESLGFLSFLVTTVHSWGGIAIAMIMVWRWQLRKRPVPLNGGQMSQLHALWVTAHHVSLYIVTVAMAGTGAMHYYLGWQFAAQWHEVGKWLLLVLIVIHVVGALVHVGRGSSVLHRMMGRGSLH